MSRNWRQFLAWGIYPVTTGLGGYLAWCIHPGWWLPWMLIATTFQLFVFNPWAFRE